jgi:probable phosphoglycerate mutase
VTTVLFDERSSEWAVPRCLGVGDVSHLYAEGLPVQPRGLLSNRE